MRRLAIAMPMLCLLAFAPPALAAPPPPNAMPLSEILRTLEASGNVAYFDEIEWDDDGYWEIEYVRRDGGKTEIKVDPVTGQQRR
jgi:hypothetical protein